VVAGAFLADLSATVFGLPTALFPAINAERFGGDPRTLGLFTAAIGIGGLVSAAFCGPVSHVSRQGRAMLASVAVWGTAFAGFAVCAAVWQALGLLAMAGAADTFTVVFRGAIIQAATPAGLRGRVMAADYVVGAGGGQLGNLEAGALGSLTSPTVSALSGGLATVAGAIAIGLAVPAFRRYRGGLADGLPPSSAGNRKPGSDPKARHIMPRAQIKDEKTYQKLRERGESKEKSARIANAAAGSSRRSVGRKGGKSGSYDDWSKQDLLGKAKEIGIKGRSSMSKSELVKALRNH
jgi:MFS family permease